MHDSDSDSSKDDKALRALWEHEGWNVLFRRDEERVALMALAVDGIQGDGSALVALLELLAYAARKPDPDGRRPETRWLEDIFLVIASACHANSRGELAGDGHVLEAMSKAAVHFLKNPSKAALATTAAKLGAAAGRAGVPARSNIGWVEALEGRLRGAIVAGSFGRDTLASHIRDQGLWGDCPIAIGRVPAQLAGGRPATDEDGNELMCPVPLRSLGWSRHPAIVRALDRWCDTEPLKGLAADDDLEEATAGLLIALGVQGRVVRDLFKARDQKIKRASMAGEQDT